MLNTAKTRTLWTAIIAGVSELLAYVATIPAEDQNEWVYEITSVFPEHYRANIGIGLKAFARAAAIYAVYAAAHSGPQTAPKNPVNE